MELTMSLETQNRLRVTEYLDLDLDREEWKCNRCGHSLGSVRENYKKGCLVHDRDPGEIHPAIVPGPFNFSPDPLWFASWSFIVRVVARRSKPNTCRRATHHSRH